jgi:hypothetical protein
MNYHKQGLQIIKPATGQDFLQLKDFDWRLGDILFSKTGTVNIEVECSIDNWSNAYSRSFEFQYDSTWTYQTALYSIMTLEAFSNSSQAT